MTLVSMAPNNETSGLRTALAMGAAGAILVSDPELAGSDALGTAKVLAAAIRRAEPDLVIAATESTDGYTGTLPVQVAELLGLPSVTFSKKVTVSEGKVHVERQTEAGYDEVEVPLPAAHHGHRRRRRAPLPVVQGHHGGQGQAGRGAQSGRSRRRSRPRWARPGPARKWSRCSRPRPARPGRSSSTKATGTRRSWRSSRSSRSSDTRPAPTTDLHPLTPAPPDTPTRIERHDPLMALDKIWVLVDRNR